MADSITSVCRSLGGALAALCAFEVACKSGRVDAYVSCLLVSCSHLYGMKVACYLGNTRTIANSDYISDSKSLEHTLNRLKCFEDPKESRIFAQEYPEPKKTTLQRRSCDPHEDGLGKTDRVVTHLCAWKNSAKTQKCESVCFVHAH